MDTTIKRLLHWLFACSLLLGSCTEDSLEVLTADLIPEPTDTLTYTGDIVPLLETYCTTPYCHDGSSTLAADLRTYDQVVGLSAEIVEEVTAGTMPMGISMAPAEVQLISDWVAQGMVQGE